MNTQHLLLLERSVDLMIFGGLFDLFRPQHSIAANLILKLYNEIFKGKNTGSVVWTIGFDLGYFNTDRLLTSLLVIKRNEESSSIVINQMYTSLSPKIVFRGDLFKLPFESISCNNFNKKTQSEQIEYLKDRIKQ